MGQEAECGLAVCLSLGVSPMVKTLAGAAFPSESSAERSSTTQLTQGAVGTFQFSYRWLDRGPQFFPGCLPEMSSIPVPKGLSFGKLSTWQLAPLEEAKEGAREYEQDGRQSLFITSTWKWRLRSQS